MGEKTLAQDGKLLDLIAMLKENDMHGYADILAETVSYIDTVEARLNLLSSELSAMQKQIEISAENGHAAMEAAADTGIIRAAVTEAKDYVRARASDIVSDARMNGKKALNRVSEFLGLKEKLVAALSHVRRGITAAQKHVSDIEMLGTGIGEAKHMAVDSLRRFTGRENGTDTLDENKFRPAEIAIKPFVLKIRLYKEMEQSLTAAIRKTVSLSESISQARDKKQPISERLAEKKAEISRHQDAGRRDELQQPSTSL